jgi:hypothetical protein
MQEMAWMRYTLMWAERGISWLFFNIVPTDIDAFVPPLQELEELLLVKVGVLGHTAASSSSLVVKRRPSSVLFEVGKKWKSLGVRSGL